MISGKKGYENGFLGEKFRKKSLFTTTLEFHWNSEFFEIYQEYWKQKNFCFEKTCFKQISPKNHVERNKKCFETSFRTNFGSKHVSKHVQNKKCFGQTNLIEKTFFRTNSLKTCSGTYFETNFALKTCFETSFGLRNMFHTCNCWEKKCFETSFSANFSSKHVPKQI